MADKYELTTNDLHTQLNILKQECERHGFSEQSERVAQRIRDLNEPLLVMVVGEGNFGKSTLINALIGKNVAPVSILPKTWKIDLYEAAQDKEEAWLYMRENPDKPKKVSIAEAIRFCEQEENNAKSMKDNGQSWKSDLFQVRWSIKAEWPQQNAVLVDTPGFSQLRADTSVSDIKLYGSNGIQMAVSDAFEYYYYRADIVLWCINGNKVQDQDTLDALSKVNVHDKQIFGVLTKMDRVPENRWDEICKEAHKVFGKYINNFICTAAGAKDKTKQTTTHKLRELLNSKFICNAGNSKVNAASSYVDDEYGTFLRTIDGIMQCYIVNIKKRDQILTTLRSKLQNIHDTSQRELEAIWRSTHNNAVSQLDSIYDKANGDIERFRYLVSEYCIDQSDLDRSINRLLNGAQQRMQAEGQMVLSRLDWDGVRIGSRSVSSFKIDSNNAIAASVNFRSKGELNLNLTTGEGVGTGVAVGGAAAAAGAFLLGPIGIAAGLIGFIAGKMMKRSNCTSEARSQISKFCDSNSSKIESNFSEAVNKYHKQLNDITEQSFSCHHGKDIDGLINHSFEADNSLNALGVWPNNRSTAIWPSIYFKKLPEGYDPISCYYFNITAIDSVQKTNWDSAVLQEWKDSLKPSLIRKILDIKKGCYNDENISNIKRKWHKTIKNSITNAVKKANFDEAAKGISIDISKILSESGISNDIISLLPSFDCVISDVNTNRLFKLKAHTVSNISNHFKNNYSENLNNIITDSLSIIGSKNYVHKRYIGYIILTVWLLLIAAMTRVEWIMVIAVISVFIPIILIIASCVSLSNKANEDAGNGLSAYIAEVRKKAESLIENGLDA